MNQLQMTSGFFSWRPGLCLLALLLLLPKTSFSALPDSAAAEKLAPNASESLSFKLQPDPVSLEEPSSCESCLYLLPAALPIPWKLNFSTPLEESGKGGSLQRGEYLGKGYGLSAEIGDLRIGGRRNTAQAVPGRGGRLAVSSGNAGNAVRLETFAANTVNGTGSEGLLAGATGEISLLAESARLKTTFLTGSETLITAGKPFAPGQRIGNLLGLTAVLDPLKGKLSAEGEIDFTVFDRNTTDGAAALRDSACRLQVGGAWDRYKYSALYERTGPSYHLPGGSGPRRDWEGVAFAVQTGFQLHAVDLKLSRYNNNTDKSALYPRLYRYEGFLDYTYRGIEELPLGLQYRKTQLDSTSEPAGFAARDSDEDAVSGRVSYLAGKWELGLHAGLSQRTDRLKDEREATAATFSLLPKFAAGPVTVAPDLWFKRSKDFAAGLRTDQYALNLGITGSLLERKLNYELNGGFKKEWAALAGYGRQTLGARVKAGYPLANLFRGVNKTSLGVLGEYKGISTRTFEQRSRDFSLLFSVERVSFL